MARDEVRPSGSSAADTRTLGPRRQWPRQISSLTVTRSSRLRATTLAFRCAVSAADPRLSPQTGPRQTTTLTFMIWPPVLLTSWLTILRRGRLAERARDVRAETGRAVRLLGQEQQELP